MAYASLRRQDSRVDVFSRAQVTGLTISPAQYAVPLVIAKKAMAKRVADDHLRANHVVTTGLENVRGCTRPTLSFLL
jgi:hypothetical protein